MDPERRSICTIGCEDMDLSDFVDRLKASCVEILFDLRLDPKAVKSEFSGENLEQVLAHEGIGYVHIEALGSPRAAREDFCETGNWQSFRQVYMKHLHSQGEALHTVLQSAKYAKVCLMGRARDPAHCHRLMVAERLKELEEGKLQIRHI
ncbi:MAG: DUF488 domain-containing protein [Candidatus Omnitrophica bacterium]|nr:DUF488 domain-containing protein [Candidatus Omnitrophota bacterium]